MGNKWITGSKKKGILEKKEHATLSVENIHFAYEKDVEILQGISISFAKGKITALLGANGCGKSTLLNLIAGVRKPDRGKILLDGKNISDIKPNAVAQKIALVHQSNQAPEDMTVRNLVSVGRTPYRSIFHRYSEEDEASIEKAMLDTKIMDYENRPIAALSGGQMQRVWLAMALAQDTDILLLDEITTYLDIHYQMEILHLIKELNKEKNRTIIMVLHDINLAFAYCDEVVIMKDGKVLTQGGIAQVAEDKILNRAFDVEAKILSIDGNKHCIFRRKGEQINEKETD